jgi:hypothetical protein
MRSRKSRAHAHTRRRVATPRAVKQAEQKRADRGAVASFVPSKPSHDAIAVALMLDLEHHALVRDRKSRAHARISSDSPINTETEGLDGGAS